MNLYNPPPDFWCWTKFFSKKEVLDLNKLINRHRSKIAVTEGSAFYQAKNSIKKAIVYHIAYKNISHKLTRLLDNVLQVNETNFGYTLYEIRNSCLNYNIYNKDGEYSFHCDGSNSYVYDIKLTLLINVSIKEYTGGEFLLMTSKDSSIINQFSNPGDVLFIKSNLLHKVSPIKKGTRESLTMFLAGPRFI